VPGIAIEYEHKTRGIMRDLGLEDWVLPMENETICR
jgi:polysaccharide pyruvyl transferase WcaK-like protein